MSPKTTSPTQHTNASLSMSRIAAHAAQPAPIQSPARERASSVCERCDLPPLTESLGRRIKQDLDLDGVVPERAEQLGMAVHDLRSPLSAIRVYSDLLAESIGNRADPELIAWIDSIHSASEFALRLLDDTLDFATVGSRAIQLRLSPGTLASIAANSVAMNRALAVRKRTRLTFVEDGEPETVLVDSVKMSKVFNNLITNAIKFSQPGAQIEVRVSHGRDRVLVSVKDNGPGIPPADLKTLFTPFQKTLARALCEEPGSGLGLAIAKRIVNLHHGRISVTSKVGVGTTVCVFLATAKKS